jgi:hypothetical protein
VGNKQAHFFLFYNMGSKEVCILGSTQCSKKIDVALIIMIPSPKERCLYWGVTNVPKKMMLI